MGSCFYYLKAYGCKEGDAEKIKSLLLELYNAENFWQGSRGIYDGTKKLSRKVFWREFESKFPGASKYLKFIEKFGKDSGNDLAGYLDFGDDDAIEDGFYIDRDGELKYSAEVWHMSDWTGFTKFLKKEFGLRKVAWVSEEDVNPFDLI